MIIKIDRVYPFSLNKKEGVMREEKVGVVDHYYTNLGVVTLTLENDLKVGDTIHVKGHTSDFLQKVESIEVNHRKVESAKSGEGIGLKVKEHGRHHDIVFKVIEE